MIESKISPNEKEIILKALYKKWPDFKRYLKTIGCPSVSAEDVFQEALLIFSRKLDDPTFELTVEPFHYVKSTCKFIWYNTHRKDAKMQTDELPVMLSEEETHWFEKEAKIQLIEQAILKIGKQCQQLLKLFYGKGARMDEIAKTLGMRNDKVAKAQKYRCLHKVREVIGTTNETDSDPSFSSLIS